MGNGVGEKGEEGGLQSEAAHTGGVNDDKKTGKPENSGTELGEIEVHFRSRKRARKSRTKRFLDTGSNMESDQKAAKEEEEMSRSELQLIKEAQELREQSRRSGLDIRVTKGERFDSDKTNQGTDPTEDDIIGGLKSNFAVERSGHAVEERMGKYIEERMREKFGDRWEGGNESAKETNPAGESDLFAIPDRLKVKERPLYDPGDGLPAAGVEEIDIPEDLKRKNVVETVRAHKELLAKRSHRENAQGVEILPGNLSANYIKHRNDWIANTLGPKGTGHPHNRNPRQNSSNTTLGSDGASQQQNGNQLEKTDNAAKPRRYQAATDGLIADRFKKRWRR